MAPDPRPVGDDSILVSGRRLEARWIGARGDDDARTTPSVPTLVFLHEGLGSVALWKDFPDRVASAMGWPALVYSRFGYGRSDPAPLPRPVTFLEEEALEVLPVVLESAGIDDAVLIGHSDGGSIALIHAAAFPSAARGRARGRIRAVIAEAPHVFVEEVTLVSIRRAGHAFDAGTLRRRLERYHADAAAAFWGFHDVWLDPRFESWRVDDRLGSIDAPLLVIQGEDDPYGTMRQVDAIRERAGSRVETFTPPLPCGHAPHATWPDLVLDEITRFLRSLDRR